MTDTKQKPKLDLAADINVEPLEEFDEPSQKKDNNLSVSEGEEEEQEDDEFSKFLKI